MYRTAKPLYTVYTTVAAKKDRKEINGKVQISSEAIPESSEHIRAVRTVTYICDLLFLQRRQGCKIKGTRKIGFYSAITYMYTITYNLAVP